MYVDADVLFLEAWELECGGYEVLFGVFVQVHPVGTKLGIGVEGGKGGESLPRLEVPNCAISAFASLKLAFVSVRDGSTETEGIVEDAVNVVEGFVVENVRHGYWVRERKM